MANKSDAIAGVAPADAITVNSKTIPEVDLTWFFAERIGRADPDLSAKQTVSVGGAAIGTFKHLPPTLTLQYRPFPNAAIQPHVGAGVNLTYTMNNNMTALGKRVTLDAYSLKPAFAGRRGHPGRQEMVDQR